MKFIEYKSSNVTASTCQLSSGFGTGVSRKIDSTYLTDSGRAITRILDSFITRILDGHLTNTGRMERMGSHETYHATYQNVS